MIGRRGVGDDALPRTDWAAVAPPAAWAVAVLVILATQLVVCANGTSRDATLVRVISVTAAAAALAISAATVLWPSRQATRGRTANIVAAIAAVGSIVLAVTVLTVASSAIC